MATFKGVSSNADNRFTDKEKKLMKTMKFPKEYELKVDFQKVNWEVMKSWIATRVTELLGVEDEVLVGYIYEQLEGQKTIDPRLLQINLTGFLEKNTSLFTKELWSLLASANETQSGIPQKILDDKAEELRKKKEMQDQINERLAKEREKREAERRESMRKEEEERRARRAERDKERAAEREKREAARKAEREKEGQRQKEIEREREKREAARRAERELEREKERERDREREKEREKDRERRRRLEEEERQKRRKRSVSPLPTAGEDAKKPRRDEETVPDGNGDAGIDKKKAKKEKKDKKAKKEKKEKKAKKEKKEKKAKEGELSRSASPGAEGEPPELDRKKSLEDDLRQKALQSVKSRESS